MEADEILSRWQAKKAATARAELLEECDTEGLALVALAAILKINNIPLDGDLFQQEQVSPTQLAVNTIRLYGKPTEEGQSREVSALYAEAYRQGWQFCTDDREKKRGHRKEVEEIVWGIDPCELTDAQLESREALAAKLADSGKRYDADRLLAMQGDRLPAYIVPE